jgi:L-threonylcarbamoyladenylate synthase
LAAEDIEAVLGIELQPPPRPSAAGPQAAPGQLPVHYSPRTPLVLVLGPRDRLTDEITRALQAHQRVGVMALEEDVAWLPPGVQAEVVGSWSDPATSAARLFAALRALDAAQLDVLFTRELADPAVGLGRALADRLRRASRRVVDNRD